jgi:hypothetical protein
MRGGDDLIPFSREKTLRHAGGAGRRTTPRAAMLPAGSFATRPSGRIAGSELAGAVGAKDHDTDVALATGEVVQVGGRERTSAIQIAQ